MIKRNGLTRAAVLVGFIVLATAATIGSPVPVGWLMGARDAILDGELALPHTAVLSGDNLRVSNGLAIVTLDQGNRIVLGRDTEASFSQEKNGVTVSLFRGTMSLYHEETGRTFQVKAGDAMVVPSQHFRTLGEIAVANGLLMVKANDGAMAVEKAGTTQEVRKGKMITIETPAAGVPTPGPQGNHSAGHLPSISPAAAILYLGIAADAGGTAWAILTASSSDSPASPVTP